MFKIIKNKKQVIDLREVIKKKESRIEPKKSKFKKNIIEWAVYIIVFMLIVWGTPLVLKTILKSDQPIASITSSSMWPVLKRGDIVLIKGASVKSDIKLGDIVVYNNERGFTIHRVVKLNDETFITKGDANNVDDEPAEYEKLIGKTVFLKNKPLRIPYLGKLSQIFKK